MLVRGRLQPVSNFQPDQTQNRTLAISLRLTDIPSSAGEVVSGPESLGVRSVVRKSPSSSNSRPW